MERLGHVEVSHAAAGDARRARAHPGLVEHDDVLTRAAAAPRELEAEMPAGAEPVDAGADDDRVDALRELAHADLRGRESPEGAGFLYHRRPQGVKAASARRGRDQRAGARPRATTCQPVRSGKSARHDSGAPARRLSPSAAGRSQGSASTALATAADAGEKYARTSQWRRPSDSSRVNRAMFRGPPVFAYSARKSASMRLSGSPAVQRVAETLREPPGHARTRAADAPAPTRGRRPRATAPPRPSGRGRSSPGSARGGCPRTGRPRPDSRAGCRSGRRAPPERRRARTRAP